MTAHHRTRRNSFWLWHNYQGWPTRSERCTTSMCGTFGSSSYCGLGSGQPQYASCSMSSRVQTKRNSANDRRSCAGTASASPVPSTIDSHFIPYSRALWSWRLSIHRESSVPRERSGRLRALIRQSHSTRSRHAALPHSRLSSPINPDVNCARFAHAMEAAICRSIDRSASLPQRSPGIRGTSRR